MFGIPAATAAAPLDYPVGNGITMPSFRHQIPLGCVYCQTCDRIMSQNLSKTAVDLRNSDQVKVPGFYGVCLSRVTKINDMLLVVDGHRVRKENGIFINNTAYRSLIDRYLKNTVLANDADMSINYRKVV